MPEEIIKIDHSLYKNQEQLIRLACSLSAATRKPCHIFNINPGLSGQSLFEAQSISKISNGRLEKDYLNSQEIRFFPGDILGKNFSFKIDTATSASLILSSLMLPVLFLDKGNSAPFKITINGGATDTFFAPTMDYFKEVFLKILEKMNIKTELSILKRGYYPEGGAKLEMKIFPGRSKSLKMGERGNLQKIKIISGASESLKDKNTAERQFAGAREILGSLKLPIEEKIEYYPTESPGNQICISAEFENTVIGADGLGTMGKRTEDLGKETATEFLQEAKSTACLDKNMLDQVLPIMALSKKSSVTASQITEAAKINIQIIEKFIRGKFKVKGNLVSWEML